MQLDRNNDGASDHWVLIVGYNNDESRYKIYDPENDSEFTYLGYTEYNVDGFPHYTAEITNDDFAKIAPSIFPNVTGEHLSTALSDPFASNEWAYINGTIGNLDMKSYRTVQGVGLDPNVLGTITFNNVSNAILRNVRTSYTIDIDNGGYNYLEDILSYAPKVFDIYNGSPNVKRLTATSSASIGTYVHGSGDLTLSGTTMENKGKAIHVGSYSYATVASTNFCQNDYDIYAENDAYFSDAYDSNVFSASDAAGCIYGDVYLPDPNDWILCGLYNTNGAPYSAGLLKTAVTQDVNDFEQALAVYKEARARRVEALAAGRPVDAESHARLFGQALQLFQEYVENHPHTPRAARALRHIETSLFELGRPRLFYTAG